MARVRLRDRTVPSKATFIQTAARQHNEMLELAKDVERLQALAKVLNEALQTELAKTIRARIWEKVKGWIQRFIKETAPLNGGQ